MKTQRLATALIASNIILLGVVIFQHLRAPDAPKPNHALWLPAADAATAALVDSDPAQNPIVTAANAVSPAVVGVGGTVSRTTYRIDPYFEDFYWPFFGRPTTQQFEVPFLGSGVFIDNKGHLVTNVHVVERVNEPFVTLSDGRRVGAKLLDRDNRVDVALLKADLDNSPYARMGDSESLVPGQWVIAIGKPFGVEIPDPAPTVTVGVVSALHRNYKAGDIDSRRIYLDMIQTDAAINPGNSGGPLVDVAGRIIGLNTFIVSRTGGSVGIGFAIPVNRVKSVVDEILKHGRLRNYQMDFDVIDMTARVARYLRVPPDTEGAVVNVIHARDGAAARAGFEVGDIITQADHLKIRSRTDLISYFLSLTVGKQIEFKILREGRAQTLRYTIEELTEQ